MARAEDIFSYFDGEEDRFGDPLEIHDTLMALLDGDVNKVLAQANAKPTEKNQLSPAMAAQLSLEAKQKLIPAIRQAFQLKDFDPKTGSGASWKVCEDALRLFVKWEETQKKSGGPEPTSSSAVVEPTVSLSPTSTSSDSGSISTGPTGVTPAASSAA